MNLILAFAIWCLAGVLVLAAALHILDRLGRSGRAICDWLSAAPALDLVVFAFVHGPWIAGWVVWWRATDRSVGDFVALWGAALVSQALALVLWAWVHEFMNPSARRGPRIVHTLNRKVGRWRNHVAVWWTALAVPIFTLVRVGELVVYPPLTWIVHLPRYRTREWVNVSRQKFSGLVGHDLIWCLYCDWMTGVWSLGSEMLRNVESFWCPIRFLSPEKCENCSVDFPDVDTHWVGAPTSGSPEQGMQNVADLLDKSYPGPGGVNAWFGHPVRLTVKGKDSGRSGA